MKLTTSLLTLLISCLFTLPALNADWASDTMQKMTLDEKIGQLLIVGTYSNKEDALKEGQKEHPTEYTETMIQQYHVGGILFKYRWDPLSQVHAVNHYQRLSSIPLLTMQDQEFGLTQRHEKALRFPKNMTLGAIQDNTLLYEFGREMARQAKSVGIFHNLAPCVDVNSNPLNPIIGARSFGDNPDNVAKKGSFVMRGLQDEGVVATAKHFPGHGNTNTDSHTSLPLIGRTKKELNACELSPFKELIQSGVKCVMSAHIVVPGLDPAAKTPATLSRPIMTELLRERLGFDGVIISDDLLMKAISQNYSPAESAVATLLAGTDLIMSSKDIPNCFEALKAAVLNKIISTDELDKRVLKVLQLKQWIREKNGSFDAKLNYETLFSPAAQKLKSRLYREALTYLNPCKLTPSTAIVQIGGAGNTPFTNMLTKEQKFPLFFLPTQSTLLERKEAWNTLAQFESFIVVFAEMNHKPHDNFGLSVETLEFLAGLRFPYNNCLYVFFGTPYALKFFGKRDSCLIAYEDDIDAQIGAAEVICGKLEAKGRLPIRRP